MLSAVRGLCGLAKNGSMMTVLPPGVVTSKHECPYQVNRVSRSSVMVTSVGHRSAGRARRVRATPRAAGPARPLAAIGVVPFAGYTRSVAADRIAQNLAFINWTVLTAL